MFIKIDHKMLYLINCSKGDDELPHCLHVAVSTIKMGKLMIKGGILAYSFAVEHDRKDTQVC